MMLSKMRRVSKTETLTKNLSTSTNLYLKRMRRNHPSKRLFLDQRRTTLEENETQKNLV